MCSMFIATTFLSITTGAASNVILQYRLNDKKRENERDGSILFEADQTLQTNTNGLQDFDLSDTIYEEFPSENLDLVEENSLSWKINRPSFQKWILTCFLESGKVVLYTFFFIGLLTVFITFIDLNTTSLCSSTSWNNIPKKIQMVKLIFASIEAWLMGFSQYILMALIFGNKLLWRLHLLLLHTCGAFLDTIYRAYLQLYDSYGWKWKSVPFNLIFVLFGVTNSFIIARHFRERRISVILLTFQLICQFLIGSITIYCVTYLVIPVFVNADSTIQIIIAAIIPLSGVVCKVTSRISAQHIYGINHPGTSYVLLIIPYAATALLTRTFQARLESLSIFILLSVFHGVTGILERISVILRDHFIIWFYKKILRREKAIFHVGIFRTPRTQRLVADVHVCNIILEITALIFSNWLVQLYTLHATGYKDVRIVYKFLSRLSLGIIFEYFSVVVSVFVLTWHLNVPVIKVWKKKWKRFILTNMIAVGLMLIYTIEYLVPVIDGVTQKRANGHISKSSNCSYGSVGVFF